MNTREWKSWWRQGLLAVGLLGMVALPGCGSSNTTSGNGESTASDTGELVIGLTDAEGDYLSYTVDVLSLTLTKANGAVVDTLPLTTRVDFAQYTEMTEFLTVATIPSGRYVKGSITLDYTNSDIWVENAAGDTVKVDNIIDGSGAALGVLEASVQLEGRNSLLIVPGVPAHLTLDFDLKASNTVEFDGAGVPTQTVQPFLLADLEPQSPKLHRLRGPLKRVNVAESYFDVVIRPFYHAMTDRHERFGILHVISGVETVYEVDGVAYTGSDGLIALESKPQYTATVVVGDLKRNPRRFVAREVYAGSSVPGGDSDVVAGTVIARSGDSLSIKGASLHRASGSISFADTVIVQVSEATQVYRQGSAGAYSKDDVSVGQRVMLFGALNDATEPLELDSTNGLARMQYTTLAGNVTLNNETDFILNLVNIDGRDIGLFDFRGTGVDEASDAMADYYEVDTAGLDVTAIADAAPVRVRGFVTAFGTAPEDFTAQTVVDLTGVETPDP